MNGEQIGRLALEAAALAWPALASWLRGKAASEPGSVADAVRDILPEEGESAKAARHLRDG